ncbi:MAG TPA: hypothetical protein VM737_08980 [Gemmatimonadota bacterium]|nr:hypothetical protein [Gemmatimonadota bacterium]
MSRPVVSAEDVRATRRRKELRLEVPPDAIITPLAREEASRHGIELVEGEAAGLARSPAPEVHRPTCDPGDVQRIVERVRTRVPQADPAQIREIARRILEDKEGP